MFCVNPVIPFLWIKGIIFCLMCIGKKQGRNEFVMRLQPKEAMYMKLTVRNCFVTMPPVVTWFFKVILGLRIQSCCEKQNTLLLHCLCWAYQEKIKNHLVHKIMQWRMTGEGTRLGHESHAKWARYVVSSTVPRYCYSWSLWASNTWYVTASTLLSHCF